MSVIIPGLYGLSSNVAWQTLKKDPQKYIDRFSEDKSVKAEVAYFEKAMKKITTVDELMKDRRALRYVLDSYGLGDEIDNFGRIKKVLTEDPTADGALSSQLSDARFGTMAKALRLDQGLDKLKTSITSGALQTSYIQNEFEEALGDQDAALRQAAYFARNVGTIKDAYSVLGDKILRSVVTSALALPTELAIQEVESQAKVINNRVDVTKFGISNSTSISATQLARAKSDHTLIETNLKISDAATKQIKSLADQLTALGNDYATLSSRTDPAGSNAAKIAVQKDAVPQLIGYDQALMTANNAVDSITTNINSLNALITSAKASGADVASLKTQFNSIVASINTKLNTGVTMPDGTTQNILMNGSADVVSIAYDQSGSTIDINRYDSSGLQGILATAADAFNAITSGGDTTNLTNAQSRLLRSQDIVTSMNTKIEADIVAMAGKIEGTDFVAALNSTDLLKGKQSVDDGLSRITKIEELLKKIGTIATTSKGMAADADRSTLETQFAAYKTELRGLIENTGAAGLDNLLTSANNASYNIIDDKNITVKGGQDLLTFVANVIDTGSLSDSASANSLYNSTISVTTKIDNAKTSLKESKTIMDNVLATYDPKGSLDSQLYTLRDQIDTLIAGAAVDGKNLLSADQSNIKLDTLSTGVSLEFRSNTTFKSDFLTAINNAIGQISSGNTNALLNAVDNVSAVVSRAKNKLDSDNRFATIEFGKLGGTIDALDPDNTSATSTKYNTNSFTEKFIQRYLTLAGSDGGSSSTSSYITALFGGSDSSSAIANIMSLAVSIKA